MPISIVIPCLNEAQTIISALLRLQPLRQRGVEVVLVDGGSDDGTLELARPAVDAALIAERGRAAQMNAGAARARGDVLLFLHADCMLPDAADALIANGLTDNGKSWGRFDVAITGRHPLLRVVALLMNWRSRLTGVATGDQGIFVRRELFQSAGRFPPIPLMEDIALTTKLARFESPLCIRQRIVTSGRRWEQGGVLRTILLMWRLRLAYWRGADPAELAARYAHRR